MQIPAFIIGVCAGLLVGNLLAISGTQLTNNAIILMGVMIIGYSAIIIADRLITRPRG